MKAIIHWNKQKRIWSHHTYLGCSWAPVILIEGPWSTELYPTKPTNPRGWVSTDSERVIMNPTDEQLCSYQKVMRLMYDKEQVAFNVPEGELLLFDEEGCHIIEGRSV